MGLLDSVPLTAKVRGALAIANFRAEDFKALDKLVAQVGKHPLLGVLIPDDVRTFNAAVNVVASGDVTSTWKEVAPSIQGLMNHPVLKKQIATSLDAVLAKNPEQHASITKMMAKLVYSPLGLADDSTTYEDSASLIADGIFPLIEKYAFPVTHHKNESGPHIVHRCRFCHQWQTVDVVHEQPLPEKEKP